MGSKAKDAASKLHEKHQAILADLLRDEDNKFCADCMAKGPRWASWNLGVFMCIRCAGIHRNLGVHISRVKSVNLDAWTPEQIESIQKGGNRRAREVYEANLPANFRRPQDDYAVEQFIRAKYERKQYINRGAATETASTSKSSKSVAEQSRVKKTVEKKPATTQNKVVSVPRPTGGRSSSPQPPKLQPASSNITKSSSARNLISLDSNKPKSKQQTLDLLTPDTGGAASVAKKPSNSLPDLFSPDARSSSEPFKYQNPPPPQQQPLVAAPGISAQQQQQQSAAQPSLMLDSSGQQGGNVKDSIMSLYNVQQPQYNSYTAQGYPVNAYYYHQQQQAAMRMAQKAQQQQHQVNQVQQQMQQIKLHQQHQPVAVGNGGVPPPGAMGGGQTLNPHLW